MLKQFMKDNGIKNREIKFHLLTQDRRNFLTSQLKMKHSTLTKERIKQIIKEETHHTYFHPSPQDIEFYKRAGIEI